MRRGTSMRQARCLSGNRSEACHTCSAKGLKLAASLEGVAEVLEIKRHQVRGGQAVQPVDLRRWMMQRERRLRADTRRGSVFRLLA